MGRSRHVRIGAAAIALVAQLVAAEVSGQLSVSPQRGQSPEQQERGIAECQRSASRESAAGAASPAPSAPVGPPPGEAIRGAGRGAAVGALGGAIGGDAGKGAAIGAGAGALFGGLRRAGAMAREQEQRSSAETRNAQMQGDVARMVATCLQSRGYSVQ